MVEPERKRASKTDVVDLRAPGRSTAATLSSEEVRAVLEAAADVIFSDGVSLEFLDQWTFETVQLLEARARAATTAKRPRAKPVTAGRR